MRIGLCATALGIAMLGTIAVAQSVNYDYDKSADFSRFKTYAWVRGTESKDELNHKRVVSAIDSQLAAKGLSRVEGERGADLLVAYHANFDENIQINGYSSGFGGPRLGNFSGTATTQRIVTGTLVVDMMNAGSGAIVWRGVAEHDLNPGAKPEKRDKNITKATEKIFKNYPPKP
jgi:Domain of unknown function (DUF4136)